MAEAIIGPTSDGERARLGVVVVAQLRIITESVRFACVTAPPGRSKLVKRNGVQAVDANW